MMKTVLDKIRQAKGLEEEAFSLEKTSDRCHERAEQLKKKANQTLEKARQLEVKATNQDIQVGELRHKAQDVLNEARLEYTKDVDGPSETKAAAWEEFLSDLK
jgi:ElaB/YqjD/DUF883 family membrane-anchored ribosome-binding protein